MQVDYLIQLQVDDVDYLMQVDTAAGGGCGLSDTVAGG